MILKISSQKIREFVEKQIALDGMVSMHDFELWLEEQPKVGEWIPCSERLPDELTPVNVTWVNRNPTIYYENIKDIPFTDTAVYCNEKWFWWSSICEDILAEYGRNDAEMVDEGVEILAWMPLPEPYKESD